LLSVLTIAIIVIAVIVQGFSTESMAILQILQLSLFGSLLIVNHGTGIRYHRSFAMLLLITVFYLAVSSLVNPVGYNGLNGFFHFLGLPLWYLVVMNFLDRHNRWRPLAITLLLMAMVICVYSLVQMFVFRVEPTAFFVQQNTNAAFLNVAAFMAMSLLVAGNDSVSQFQKRCLYAGLILIYFTLFSIAGRGALLGNLAGLILLSGVLITGNQRRTVLPLLLSIVIAFAASGVANEWNTGARFMELGEEMLHIQDDSISGTVDREPPGSVAERFLIWNSALEMFRNTPWYGSGYGSFHMRYPAYRSTQDTSAGQYVHNDFLQFLVEFGYPGIVLCAGFIIYFLVRAVRFFRSRQQNRAEAAAMLAVLLATSVYSLFSYNFYIPVMLLLMALCIGRFMTLDESVELSRYVLPQRVNKRLFCLVTGGLLLLPILAFASTMVMNHYYEKGRALYRDNDIIAADYRFIRAARWFNTENIQIARALVNLSVARSLADKSGSDYRNLLNWGLEHLQAAETMNPWLAQVPYVYGLYLLEFRETLSAEWQKTAIQALLTALAKDRRHFEARLALAGILADGGDLPQAQAVLEQGLAYPLPDNAEMENYLLEVVRLRKFNGMEKQAATLEKKLAALRKRWRDNE
jgi:O-antigen ligase